MQNEFQGLRFSSIAIPLVPVDHPDYVWRPSADCDVQRTWRNYGWKPLNEQHTNTTTVQPRAAIKVVREMQLAL